MVKTIILSGALAFGLVSAASAGIAYTPIAKPDPAVVKVAEGCGPGMVARTGRTLPSDGGRPRVPTRIPPWAGRP